MQGIQQWAFSICAAMTACGLAYQIMPKSNMEKIFRTIVSIFFLCCLLSPVAVKITLPDIEVEQYSKEQIEERAARLNEVMTAQLEQAAEIEMQKIITDNLAQMGIKHHRATINIKTNGQNAREIEYVEIELQKEHESRHKEIHAKLAQELGVTVKLGYLYSGEGDQSDG